MKYQPGGDVDNSGGSWVSEPGSYHVTITNAQEPPTNKVGALITNGMFKVDLEIVDGTNKTQINKTKDLVFFAPKAGEKNDGAFTKKKVDRFLLAVGLATREQIESKAALDVDVQKSVGHQFVVEFERDEKEPKYVNLAFANIYHVDDPAVKDVPKSNEMLGLIPASQRWTPQQAAANTAKPTTAAATTEAKPAAAGMLDDV